jgi:hypothetical protein
MTQENARMPSSLWMLDRAERLFEKAETSADPAEASSLRRMGTNFLAGAEANGATVSDIRARYRIACPAARSGNVIFMLPRHVGLHPKG